MPQNSFQSPYHPLSDQELEKSYWFITHKIFIKRLGYSLFIGIDLILIVFSAYKMINYYSTESKEYSQAMQDFYIPAINHEATKLNQPANLEIDDVKILNSGQTTDGKKYDLIAKIYNPNDNFRIDFAYQFIFNGNKLPERSSFILPKETKVITAYSLAENPSTAKVMITKASMQRISAKEISNPPEFVKNHLNFSLKNAEIKSLNTPKDLYKVSFDLSNETIYNYWDINLTILLYNGAEIIGINEISLEKFLSGETRPVEINWYEFLPSNIKVSIIPEIDIFNPEVYMDFQGTQEGLGFENPDSRD